MLKSIFVIKIEMIKFKCEVLIYLTQICNLIFVLIVQKHLKKIGFYKLFRTQSYSHLSFSVHFKSNI